MSILPFALTKLAARISFKKLQGGANMVDCSISIWLPSIILQNFQGFLLWKILETCWHFRCNGKHNFRKSTVGSLWLV